MHNASAKDGASLNILCEANLLTQGANYGQKGNLSGLSQTRNE